MDVNKTVRQYDLDWIRVIATIGVFLYHCSMFFNPFPWHVKNNTIDTSWILVFSLFVGVWIMPIFFAISGMNTIHSLTKRSTFTFLKERFIRLGIPLVFGVFILSPPQVFIERITNDQFSGTFLQFLPTYFDGLYLDIGGNGNFAFSGLHLWYLLVLLVFSIVALPIFKLLPQVKKFSGFHFLLLPFILFLSGVINTLGLGGWDLVFYFIIFIYGYYFFSSATFKPALKSNYKKLVVIAIITSVIYIVWFMIGLPVAGSIQDYLFYGVKVIACWSWLCVIFSLAAKYLAFSNRFLTYSSEASMPFYVLHQPIIVFIGFLIHDLSWPILYKMIFLILSSFSIIMLIYHFVIRKINILRILFGLKGNYR
ncbi:acyltransferase family protein [Lysinibacillus sp. BW-2-10]|uniref:acyltransferase family protein n=1 Tax=Lysinibacillus sp. BW-2-10 TaxID=2590030 RepID=UPI00117D297E|nr:acyltransferase family protein [Lysinibacillus sp. BW-2-10]TSI03203.1 acyltransferase family protein [Lysinibacillus sp. BW-2-10]